VVGAVVVRPVRLVSVACRRFVTRSTKAHGYRSNLVNAVRVVDREFFDSDVEEKTMYARQATATNSNLQHISLVSPSDYRCWMTSGLSPGRVSHSPGHQCSLHSVNRYHHRDSIRSSAIVRSPEWPPRHVWLWDRGFQMIGNWKKGGDLKIIGSPGTRRKDPRHLGKNMMG